MRNRRRRSDFRDKQMLPAAVSAWFLLLSAVLWAGWFTSPEQQARSALLEAYSYCAPNAGGETALARNLREAPENPNGFRLPAPLDFIPEGAETERVQVKKLTLREKESGDSSKTYTFDADLEIVLDKGNQTMTPVYPETVSGTITMTKDGPLSWKADQIGGR